MRRPGILYALQDGRFAIAFHDEQKKAFISRAKVVINICDKDFQIQLNEQGKLKKVLKDISKLKIIGRVD